jgi:fructose-1,6-bisphosphatase/inositol monophosphatase family enzyme
MVTPRYGRDVDDLELAASVVHEAGKLAAQMLQDGLTVRQKTSISDVVTAADHAAEDLVVARLRAERPADGIVGEEGTDHAGDGRTWYVDPVDGTYNFLAGLPVWCTAIALDETLGAVYQPAAGELWAGGPAHPTTCNGVPVDPLDDASLAALSVVTYLHPTTLPDDSLRVPLFGIVQRAATVRMLGSGSVELAGVAGGRLGVSVQTDSLPWDWLPGAALVRGAGGTASVIEAHGHRWHLAGPTSAVAEIAELLLG